MDLENKDKKAGMLLVFSKLLLQTTRSSSFIRQPQSLFSKPSSYSTRFRWTILLQPLVIQTLDNHHTEDGPSSNSSLLRGSRGRCTN